MILEKIGNPKGHPKPTNPNGKRDFDAPCPALLALIDEDYVKSPQQVAETLEIEGIPSIRKDSISRNLLQIHLSHSGGHGSMIELLSESPLSLSSQFLSQSVVRSQFPKSLRERVNILSWNKNPRFSGDRHFSRPINVVADDRQTSNQRLR